MIGKRLAEHWLHHHPEGSIPQGPRCFGGGSAAPQVLAPGLFRIAWQGRGDTEFGIRVDVDRFWKDFVLSISPFARVCMDGLKNAEAINESTNRNSQLLRSGCSGCARGPMHGN